MKIVVLIFACLLLWLKLVHGFVPTTLDITLTCDPRPTNEQVLAYRFYEKGIGTNWTFLGSRSTNRIVLSNVVVLLPHIYGVSASNVLGESDLSIPYVAPTDPHPPLRLKVPTTNGIVLESTLDMGFSWFTIATITNDPATLLMQRFQVIKSSRVPPLPK